MGQIYAVDRLPVETRKKVLKMLNEPYIPQKEIVNEINTEAGTQILSLSALNRYVRSLEKQQGVKRGKELPSTKESLNRIAVALERIASVLEIETKTFYRSDIEAVS